MQWVALQLDMVWKNKAANHEAVRAFLSKDKPEPGSLVVLPEMFETGFSMDVAETAQSEHREAEGFLRETAKQFDVAILGGIAAPIESGRSRNEAVAFAPDGTELMRYRKRRPFSVTREGEHYVAGDQAVVFEWQGVKIAPAICYDLRFPELFRESVRLGAEAFVVIACWPQVRSEHWVRLLQARAIENLGAVLGVNRCGTEPGLVYDGRSCAFDHLGQPQFEANGEPQIKAAEIDIDELRRWRRRFPALRDMA